MVYFLELASALLLVGKTLTLHDRKPKLFEPKDCFRVKGGLWPFKDCIISLHILFKIFLNYLLLSDWILTVANSTTHNWKHLLHAWKLKGMQPSSHPNTFTEAAEVFLTLLLLKIFLWHSDRQEQFSNRGLNVNIEMIILCARKEKLQIINQVLQHRLIHTYQLQIFCEILKKS